MCSAAMDSLLGWDFGLFACFLRDRGQWDAAQLRCRHSGLIDQFERHLIEMRGLAATTTAAHLRLVRRTARSYP
jgi:hypothetical protein